jgi:hypothetical protein
MSIINCTSHKITVFPAEAFSELEQINPTTWLADSVDESLAIASFAPGDKEARIATTTTDGEPIAGIPTVQTKYGELTGVPPIEEGNYLIVSLPTQSMGRTSGHPLASQMMSPHKVVRLRSNSSTVLGCMGFTFQ